METTPSVKRKDYQALNLVGPTKNNPVLDPLAVQHLDNRLYILDRPLKFEVLNSLMTLTNPPVDGDMWKLSCNLRLM